MSRYVPVVEVDRVPEGHGLKVQVEGLDLAVFHIDGEFHVFQDVCCGGADLARAQVADDGNLLCPHHGWRFDVRDGVCSMVPDNKVNRFPVKVEDGRILVDLEA